MDKKISVVITDDHNLFRKGLNALLSDFSFVGEINEAGNGKELLDLLHELEEKPDLILLDLNMPVMDGEEVLPKIKELYPDIKIVILSMEDDIQMVSFLIDQGINGYLLKNADPDELELALKKVLKNDFYFSSSLSGAVLSNLKSITNNTDEKTPQLTSREEEVLKLICEELTASEIGEKLSISARTVEGYKRKLLEKTGTKNMAGLVVFAIKNDFVKI